MSKKINNIFKALADPTRREIFHLLILASSALTMTQISDHFNMTRQGITKHLKLLENAGLVNIEDQGRERLCSADIEPFDEIKNWFAFYESFWNKKIDNLSEYLDTKKNS